MVRNLLPCLPDMVFRSIPEQIQLHGNGAPDGIRAVPDATER